MNIMIKKFMLALTMLGLSMLGKMGAVISAALFTLFATISSANFMFTKQHMYNYEHYV